MREFDQLNNPEKVKAVLATVHEPTTRSVILWLSGIDAPKLRKAEREEIDGVLTEVIVNPNEPKGRQKFLYPMERREAVFTALDVDKTSVGNHVIDLMIASLPDFGLGKGLTKR